MRKVMLCYLALYSVALAVIAAVLLLHFGPELGGLVQVLSR